MAIEAEKIYLSTTFPGADGGAEAVKKGDAGYSYRTVYDKFKQMYEKQGLKVTELKYPESVPLGKINKEKFKEDIHITFKPPSDAAILKGAFNIAHFAWEFPQIPTGLNQLPSKLSKENNFWRMRYFNELWVGCNFTKKVLIENGFTNVYVIPAPIEISTPIEWKIKYSSRALEVNYLSLRRMSINLFPVVVYSNYLSYKSGDRYTSVSFGEVYKTTKIQGGTIFLQILNPFDFRKDLDTTLRAFAIHAEKKPLDILVLKLTCRPKNGEVYSSVFTKVLNKISVLKSKNIFFTTDYIFEKDFKIFLSCFDFYFSPTRAEGQNLPLQEAMSCGVIPVVPRHTAMLDYIFDDNSIILDSNEELIRPSAHPDETFWGRVWNQTVIKSCVFALRTASELSIEERKLFSKNASKRIHQNYNFESVMKLIRNRVKNY